MWRNVVLEPHKYDKTHQELLLGQQIPSPSVVELCCTSGAGSGDATSYTTDEKLRRENLLIISHRTSDSRESATPASLTTRCYNGFSHFRWFLYIWRCKQWWRVLWVPDELTHLRYDVAMATPSKAVGRWRFMSDIQAKIIFPWKYPGGGVSVSGSCDGTIFPPSTTSQTMRRPSAASGT